MSHVIIFYQILDILFLIEFSISFIISLYLLFEISPLFEVSIVSNLIFWNPLFSTVQKHYLSQI